MARRPVPTWFFALVVVRRGDRFLVVQERRHGQRWYLPAGRVEPGEGLVEGAVREVLEESGVPVRVEGVLRFEYTPHKAGTRVRVIFLARPVDNTPPGPTDDSLDARWVTPAELRELPLRGEEVRRAIEYVAGGGPVYPLTVLTGEGAPFPAARAPTEPG